MTPTMPPLGSLKLSSSISSRSPKPLRRLRRFDHQIAQPRPRRDVQILGFVTLLEFLRFQFLEAGHAGLALGVATLGVGAHPFQFRLHGLGVGGFLFLLDFQPLFLLFQPGGVVALPRNAVTAIQFQNPAGDIVEEVAVVGDGDHGAGVILQEALQPGHRFGVQMVGRFVQQQHVGLGQQQPAQGDAALFAAGQLADLGIPGRQAQGVGGDFQGAIQVMAVGGVQVGFQFGLFGGQLVEIGVRLGVGGIDLIEPGLGGLDRRRRLLRRCRARPCWDRVAAPATGSRSGCRVAGGPRRECRYRRRP